MADNKKSSDFNAAIAAALSLGLGFAVAALLKTTADIKDASIIVTLLVIPLLVYGVVSGRILELRGPHGLGATFAKSANRAIGRDFFPIEPILVQKDFIEPSKDNLRKKQKGRKNRRVASSFLTYSEE